MSVGDPSSGACLGAPGSCTLQGDSRGIAGKIVYYNPVTGGKRLSEGSVSRELSL